MRPELDDGRSCRSRDGRSDRARRQAIDLVKPRARKLADLVGLLRPFSPTRSSAIRRRSRSICRRRISAPHLAAWRDRLRTVEPFDAATLEAALRALAEERGIKAGTLIHATRVAVTGQAVSPGIFEVLELIGRDRVIVTIGRRRQQRTDDQAAPSSSQTERKPRAVIARALTEAEFERARRHADAPRSAARRAHQARRAAAAAGRHAAHDPFAALVRVILSQQLSGKAADTIFGRVVALVGGRELPDAGEPPRRSTPTALRGAGVSRPKISYLHDLAERVHDGRLDLHALDGHPDEEVIAQITAVKGLGRWSAEMFLMFRLNRPDILPVGDLGIVKGVQKLFGMKRRPSPRTMMRLAESWRPYRSVAAWYLWRIHRIGACSVPPAAPRTLRRVDSVPRAAERSSRPDASDAARR